MRTDGVKIRRANMGDYENIVSLIDNEFTKQGFGFVNRAQIMTEITKNRVLVAEIEGKLSGVRIGINTLWNLVVSKEHRGAGVGRSLVEYHMPQTIRVKSDPIGHLSKKQKEEFVDPTGFYDKLGFKFWGYSYPKNFWQKGRDNKGQFHAKGDKAHIKIYKDPKSVMGGFLFNEEYPRA
jgi:GNAT superfamily N-acetyltransferase